MERERGYDEDTCAQAMVAIIFLSRQGTKTFSSDGVFWIARGQWEVTSVAFLSGYITGWLGFTKKKGSRTEGFVTRHGPRAKHGRQAWEGGI